MYNPIIDNQDDDDIFDDNKTLEDINLNSDNRKKNSDFINNNFTESFNEETTSDERLKKFLSFFGSDVEGAVGNIRYKLTTGFYESVSKWLFEYKVNDISYGTYSYLSSLGDNRFPLYYRFYELESEILKKQIICSFLKDTFLNKNAVSAFEKLNKIIKTNLDERYLITYFQPVYEILKFTIIQEIGLYRALGKKLNLETLDSVIDGTGSVSALSGAARRNVLIAERIDDELKEFISTFINEEMKKNEL